MWPVVFIWLNVILVLGPLTLLVVFLVRMSRGNREGGRPPVYRVKKLRFNLTAHLEFELDSLRAIGEKSSYWDRVDVSTEGYGDPAARALRAGKATKEDAELIVDSEGIFLASEGRHYRFPRSALKSVGCASPRGGRRRNRGHSSQVLYVYLCFDDSRLGNVAVGVFAFTIGVTMLLGDQTTHPYSSAVERAETLAHSISDSLEIPLQPNHYRGLFAGLASYMR